MIFINFFGIVDVSLRALVLTFLVIIGVIIYNVKRWKMYKLAMKLDGPKSYPIIGGAHHFIGLNTSQITSTIFNYCNTYISPVKFWLGPRLLVIVSEPEDLHEVLNSQNCLDKDEFYKVLSNMASSDNDQNLTSLITSKSKIWKHNRKMLNPCFNFNIIKSFLPIFNEESKTMIEVLKKNVGKGSFDIFRYGAACSLDMICRSSMGVRGINIQKRQDYSFIIAFESIFEIVFERLYKLHLRPNFIFKHTSYYKDWQKYKNVINQFQLNIIERKKEQIINGPDKIDPEKCDIFLHQLLKAESQGKITAHDIVGEVFTLLLAGNDTTATSLSFTILSLAMHPEVQDKLFAEINEVFPDNEFEVTLDDIPNLTYTDMVMKEALRIFPVVPFIAREVTADMKIRGNVVPAGVSLLMPIYSLHRNPKIWGPNADKFDPDNFLPENVAMRHPCSYLPFSTGPRNCIGMKQGTFAVKIMLIHLIKFYKFKTEFKMESLRVKTDITMKLLDRHMISIEKRD